MEALFALLSVATLIAGCNPHRPDPGPHPFTDEQQAELAAQISRSHIEGNVPDQEQFSRLMKRDLAEFLRRSYGELEVDYELLREGPTQVGVGYPHFYVWLTDSKLVVTGAASVTAMDKKRFRVDRFLSANELLSERNLSDFPEVLLPLIREKARAAMKSRG